MSKHHSPLLGYNNNVRHKGRVFHIQTEDSGVKHPHIITHLFMDGGRILKSTKTSYADVIGAPDMADTVRKMMKDQHKAMFTALRDGQFDHLFEARASMAPPPMPAKEPSAPPPPPRAPSAPPRPMSERPPRASERPPPASQRPAARRSERPPPVEEAPSTLRESAPPALTLDFDDAFAEAALMREPDLPPPPPNVLSKHTPEPGTGGRYRTLRDPRVDPDSSSEMKVAKRADEAPRSARPPKTASEPRAPVSHRDPRVDPESSGTMRAASKVEREERVALKPGKAASERPPSSRGGEAKERPRRSSRPPKPGYAPARPAAIFGPAQQRPQGQGGSIFGEDLISDKSLDEVILSYLAEDLEGDK